MSLATRCPACGTVFRVVPDQLKVSEGWVRCGRCSEVFNGAQRLFELEATSPAAPPRPAEPSAPAFSTVPPAAPPIVVDAPAPAVAEAAPAETPAPPALATVDTAAANAPAPEATITAEAPAAAPPPSPDGPPPAALSAGSTVETAPSAVAQPAHADASDAEAARDTASDAPAAQAATLDAPAAQATALDVQAAQTAASQPQATDTAAAEATATPSPATPGFVRRAEQAARWRSPRRRAALAMLSLGLALLLAAQVALQYRDQVAARWPATLPWLQSACAALDCRVEAPRYIDALNVDSSGLVRLPDSTLYKLSVVVQNKASMRVRMPAVDLALTDLQGQTTVRRVLSAAELGQAADSVPARGEVTLQATLDLGERRIAGYTIELFYP